MQTDPAIRNLKEEPSFPQSLALLPHSDFRAGQSVYSALSVILHARMSPASTRFSLTAMLIVHKLFCSAKYGRNRVGETDRGGERYETKNGHKVRLSQ